MLQGCIYFCYENNYGFSLVVNPQNICGNNRESTCVYLIKPRYYVIYWSLATCTIRICYVITKFRVIIPNGGVLFPETCLGIYRIYYWIKAKNYTAGIIISLPKLALCVIQIIRKISVHLEVNFTSLIKSGLLITKAHCG